MARVVQRRTNAPYLLVMFIFLFLLAAVLAVVFYNGQIALRKELDKDRVNTKALNEKYEAVAGARGDLPNLVFLITGNASQAATAQMAMDDANTSLALPNSRDYKNSGLAAAIRAMNDKIDQKSRENGELKAQVDEKTAAIKTEATAFDKARSDFATKLQLAQEEATMAKGVLSDAGKDVLKQMQTLKAESDAVIAEKDKKIAAKVDELLAKDTEVREKEKQIRTLDDAMRKLKPQLKAGELMLRRPDGKVARALLDKNICYIDLGERERITPGLPFSVYAAQTGIPDTGAPKGKIVVINVGATTSECRIVESSREDPILENDLIANVVYNPTRTYNFVVEGDFDLYNEGRTDLTGNRQVKTLIEGFGGKVEDEVTITTDFVVLGEEPERPPKPEEGAEGTTAAWQIYNDKMKKVEHYQQVKVLAGTISIPVLNTNRFLAFTGFVPKKRLVD